MFDVGLLSDAFTFPTHRLSPHLLMDNGTCQFLFLFLYTEHFVTGIKKPKLTFSILTQTEIRSLFYSLVMNYQSASHVLLQKVR